jgi:hypothetical protein
MSYKIEGKERKKGKVMPKVLMTLLRVVAVVSVDFLFPFERRFVVRSLHFQEVYLLFKVLVIAIRGHLAELLICRSFFVNESLSTAEHVAQHVVLDTYIY